MAKSLNVKEALRALKRAGFKETTPSARHRNHYVLRRGDEIISLPKGSHSDINEGRLGAQIRKALKGDRP